MESLKQLLQNYQDKEKYAQEALKQQLDSHAKLGEEIGKLRQLMETERSEFQKRLDDVTQERDKYKAKTEEMQTPTAGDNKVIEQLLLSFCRTCSYWVKIGK